MARISLGLAAPLVAACIGAATGLSPQANAALLPLVDPATPDARADSPADPHLLAVGAGALVGVVAFNILTGPLGVVPLAGGVLAAVPYNVALGSRLIMATTASVGMIGATWAYDQYTGQRSDYGYLLTLGAGALVGVAAGNYLLTGMIGTPPYYAGAGLANVAGGYATGAAQAASRIYVVGSGVLGAWAADWLYRR